MTKVVFKSEGYRKQDIIKALKSIVVTDMDEAVLIANTISDLRGDRKEED